MHFCVYIHRGTFSFMMMRTNTNTTMMMVIMSCMTPGVYRPLDIATNNYLDYDGSKGCEPSVDSPSHVWIVCIEVLHIQFSPYGRPPLGFLNDRSLEHIACVCIFTAPIVGHLLSIHQYT